MYLLLIVFVCLFALYVLALKGRTSNKNTQKFLNKRYAHRGLHKKTTVPENSMAAFKSAVDKGYGIELDVHLMSDGNLAVIHDSSLKRTAGVDICIEELTAADLNKFPLEGSNETIPLFQDVLKLVDGKVPLLIEIKTAANIDKVTRKVVENLKDYNGEYCIESFDPRCILWLKKNAPNIVRGQLTQDFIKEKADLSVFTRFLLTPLILNFVNRPDFIALKYSDRKEIQFKIVKSIWKLPLFAWTVTDRETAVVLDKEGYTLIFEQFEF